MSPGGDTAGSRRSSVRNKSGQGTFQATSIPEPATLTLTAIGGFGLLFDRWRRPARGVARPVARESGTCWNMLGGTQITARVQSGNK